MKILLTGNLGYTGSVLRHKLALAGHYVVGVDVGWFMRSQWTGDDVRRVKSLIAYDGKPYDAVIHLAAIANDPTTSEWPRLAWETSALATQQLCQAAVRDGVRRFIYASSVSVYGADRGMVTEDMELQPLSDYNKVKMCTERILLSYRKHIIPQIIRPATVCGLSPRMRLDVSVNMLTMQALTKGVMTIHGGQQMRPSIHIDDLCDLYIFMLEHQGFEGVYNAGFENHSLLELAKKVQAVVPSEIKITEQRDARSYQVNSDKLLATGFKPKKTVDDAIHEIVAAYAAGSLKDEPNFYNLGWMRHVVVKDE